MRIGTFSQYLLTAGAVCALQFSPNAASAQALDDEIWVRDGYELSVATDAIASPRFMAVTEDGTLFVSVPKENLIKTCRDKDGDGVFESIVNFVENHKTVHGVYWHDGWLWFTETAAVFKAKDVDGDGKADVKEKVLGEDQVPSDGTGHWWRSILIHNDRIYTSVGDQGNATDEEIDDSERKKIWSFALDGTDKKLFSTGVRNTEKFAVRPGTNEIWGVDHDIDKIWEKYEKESGVGQPATDLNPPAELNLYVEGGFYGHPFVTGNKVPNLNFLDREDIIELAAESIAPEWNMPAHCSGVGMTFYDADQFPAELKGDAFVAQRGSWNNATNKVGYCVVRILFEFGHPYGEQKFVNFLTTDQTVKGRPADVTVDKNGTLLISDDTGNKIYRLTYVGKK